MPFSLARKEEIVAEVNAEVREAVSAATADYRGLTVAEMTSMRADARSSGVSLRVIRNTLARRAVEGTVHECMKETFSGPTLLALCRDDPGAAARLLKKYVDEFRTLEVTALSVDGELLEAGQLNRIASLPTLDEARARLMRVLLAPVDALARTLKEVPGTVVRAVAAVRDSRQSESTGSESEQEH